MTPFHPREQLHELLDGRLDPAQQAALELHLRQCASCQAELEALRRTKEALRRMADEPLPQALEPRPRRRLAWAAAAAAVVAVILTVAWLLRERAPQDLPAQADAQWQTIASRPEALEIRSSDASEVDRFFRDRGLPFPSRVFDLAMMGWQLEGARLARIDGKEAAVWNYRAPDGRPLVCVMLVGGMGELPEPDQQLEHEGRPFHAYERSERTIVFWPEGPVLCALIGIGDPAEVIALAKAKAMGPA